MASHIVVYFVCRALIILTLAIEWPEIPKGGRGPALAFLGILMFPVLGEDVVGGCAFCSPSVVNRTYRRNHRVTPSRTRRTWNGLAFKQGGTVLGTYRKQTQLFIGGLRMSRFFKIIKQTMTKKTATEETLGFCQAYSAEDVYAKVEPHTNWSDRQDDWERLFAQDEPRKNNHDYQSFWDNDLYEEESPRKSLLRAAGDLGNLFDIEVNDYGNEFYGWEEVPFPSEETQQWLKSIDMLLTLDTLHEAL